MRGAGGECGGGDCTTRSPHWPQTFCKLFFFLDLPPSLLAPWPPVLPCAGPDAHTQAHMNGHTGMARHTHTHRHAHKPPPQNARPKHHRGLFTSNLRLNMTLLGPGALRSAPPLLPPGSSSSSSASLFLGTKTPRNNKTTPMLKKKYVNTQHQHIAHGSLSLFEMVAETTTTRVTLRMVAVMVQ